MKALQKARKEKTRKAAKAQALKAKGLKAMMAMKAANANKAEAMKKLKAMKAAKAKETDAMKVMKAMTVAKAKGDTLMKTADGHEGSQGEEAGYKNFFGYENIFVQRIPSVWVDEKGDQGPVGTTWQVDSAEVSGKSLLIEWHEVK